MRNIIFTLSKAAFGGPSRPQGCILVPESTSARTRKACVLISANSATSSERRVETPPTNEELIEAVGASLNSDIRVDATNIEVEAQQGHVILRGYVPSMRERQLAEVAARQVTGAVWTTNLLSVRTITRPDEELLRDVTRLLEDDSYLRQLPIATEVLRGIVTLRGTVSTHSPRMRATELAGRVQGVRGVH